MTRKAQLSRWRWPRLVALAVVVALCPLPALADDQAQPTSKGPGIRASAAAIAKTHPLAASPSAAAQTDTGGTDSPSFFRTPAGVVTLVLIGAGVGYALYSTRNDRVKSPAR